MSDLAIESSSQWLSDDELAAARERLPILYVDAVPVRVDHTGTVTSLGLLLRVTGHGDIHRALVTGRVLYAERVRDALLRHLEKDLGGLALPRLPAHPTPFTVAEYFPVPGVTPFHDPRQHAVSLAFVVPVEGDCTPQQDALEITWVTPAEAADVGLQAEMVGGQGHLLRQALGACGF